MTQIKMETLVQVLAVLFKAKLLVSEDEELEEQDIVPTTPVKLFLNYKKYTTMSLYFDQLDEACKIWKFQKVKSSELISMHQSNPISNRKTKKRTKT